MASWHLPAQDSTEAEVNLRHSCGGCFGHSRPHLCAGLMAGVFLLLDRNPTLLSELDPLHCKYGLNLKEKTWVTFLNMDSVSKFESHGSFLS